MYNSLILPVLDYGDIIWGDKAARIILDLPPSSHPSTDALRQLPWKPLEVRRSQHRVIFMYRCVNNMFLHIFDWELVICELWSCEFMSCELWVASYELEQVTSCKLRDSCEFPIWSVYVLANCCPTKMQARLDEIEIFITYLLGPRETVCFVDPRDHRRFSGQSGGQQRRSRGHKTHCFPEVSVNKCFVM
jgi:hypothetical protein